MKSGRDPLQTILTMLFFVALIVGLGLTVLTSFNSYRSQQDFLKQRIAGLAAAIPQDDIALLTASEEDLETELYAEFKQRLISIADANPDIEFVYATKLIDGAVYFVADSAEAGSEDESPAGQEYEEADQLYIDAHSSLEPSITPPTRDRWGVFVSGLAPVIYNDEVIAVLGIDVDANNFISQVVLSGIVPLLFTIIVAAGTLILRQSMSQRLQKHAQQASIISLVNEDMRLALDDLYWIIGQIESLNPSGEIMSRLRDMKGSIIRLRTTTQDVTGLVVDSIMGKHSSARTDVDVAYMVYDLVISLHASMARKQLTIQWGSDWKSSYVAAVNEKLFTRAMTSLLNFMINRAHENTSLKINLVPSNNNWLITLAYSGDQLSEKEIKSLLSSREKSTASDSLLLVSSIIQQHGGNLSLQSDSQQTSFEIKVPVTVSSKQQEVTQQIEPSHEPQEQPSPPVVQVQNPVQPTTTPIIITPDQATLNPQQSDKPALNDHVVTVSPAHAMSPSDHSGAESTAASPISPVAAPESPSAANVGGTQDNASQPNSQSAQQPITPTTPSPNQESSSSTTPTN